MLTLLLDCLVKATVLLGLAFLAAGMLRHASAAVRHLVWTLSLAGLLVLPVLAMALPGLHVLPTWATSWLDP